jgi:hypothetical protein
VEVLVDYLLKKPLTRQSMLPFDVSLKNLSVMAARAIVGQLQFVLNLTGRGKGLKHRCAAPASAAAIPE